MKLFYSLLLICTCTTLCVGQNVGIGVTNPLGKLDIRHTSSLLSPTLNLYDNNPGNFARLQFQNASSTKFWNIAGFLHSSTDASSRLNFYHSVYGDLMSLTGDGKVGIGTTSPSERLDINGNLNLWGTLRLGTNPGLAGQILVSNGTAAPSWQHLPAGASVWSVAGNNIYNNNTGRVGIGTALAPVGQLEIKMNSGAEPQLLLTEDGNDFSRLTYRNTNGVSFTTAGYRADASNADHYNIYSHRSGTDLVQVTTDPKNTLAVNGSLRLKKISVVINIGFNVPGNNIDIGDASILELSWASHTVCTECGPGEITGIAGGVEGRILYVFKADQGYRSFDWDNNYYAFRENDSRSLPENRFAFQNIDLDNFDGLTLIYLNGRWRCLGRYN